MVSGERTKLKQSGKELVQARLQIDRTQIVALCEQFEIIELGIFGSALREDFRAGGDNPSDVDILVEFDDKKRLTWQAWLDLQRALEALLQRRVDVVRKHLLKNPYRRAEILKTNCIMYEQSESRPGCYLGYGSSNSRDPTVYG